MHAARPSCCRLSHRHHPLSATAFSFSSQPPVPLNNTPDDGNRNDSDNSAITPTAEPIDFFTQAKIEGEESQIVTIQLQPNQTLRAESGAMIYMTQDITMHTSLQDASSTFKRMMTGQNMFLTDFTGSGTIALGTNFPSKLLNLSLPDYDDSTLICQRGAFLACNHPTMVQMEMEFTKSFTSGFFGGQGFVLQKLSGTGDVVIQGGGTIVQRDLAPNETLRVTSGSIVAFTASVQYDVQMMAGVTNVMFGGEGLFVTKLTGPGKVWLQGLPPDRMIAEIARRVPAGGGLGVPIPIGVGGGGASDAPVEDAAGGDVGGEEVVAASEMEDRQATVASSGMMDAESSEALFGDAAVSPSDAMPSSEPFSDDPFASSSETTFSDEDLSTPDFGDDDTSFSTNDDGAFGKEDGDHWGEEGFDSTEMEGLGEEATEDAGQGLLGMLWDLFNDD